MAEYELIYFNVKGRGEAIRHLFVDNGIDYTETNCGPWQRWVDEFKPTMHFGQAPAVKHKDFLMVQSNAILRYIAKKHGLYGSSDEEAALIDMINDAVEDLRLPYTKMVYQNYDDGKEPFIATLPTSLGYLENFVSKNGNGKSGFAVGSKSSYADYNLADQLDNLVTLSSTCLDNFPTLAAFRAAHLARPNIAKYHETEAFKTRPRNGNNKE